jgi:4-hydroxy-tetrahydrodipicolinate reductase
MSPERLRVIQWATGNTGQRSLREVIRDPSLELVGVLVYDAEKDGVDAGALCGEARTGIAATLHRQTILNIDADCCLYMARASGTGAARAGLTEDELADDMVALLERGINVVTTCTDLIARGAPLSEANRSRVLDACQRGQASVWASGSDPGFITETIPLALLSIQRQVELIEIDEFGDLSRRPSPHMVMEQMGFGKSPSGLDPERRKNHLLGAFQPALSVLADLSGFDIDAWTSEGAVATAKEDLTIVSGLIKQGTLAAQRITVTGRSQGADRVRFNQYTFVALDVDPAWELQSTGWRVRVHGDAPIDLSMPFPVPLEGLAGIVPAFNANGPVNAIPYVCAAAPGILTTRDLPYMLRQR